jgi:hypothetical protein
MEIGCKLYIPGSFLEVKQPELSINHPSQSSAEVKERVEVGTLYLYGVF